VESILDTLSRRIVDLSLNPARYCALYARPAIRRTEMDNLWIAYALFGQKEPGMPDGMTTVRMPSATEDDGWWEHRPMFMNHLEAAKFTDESLGMWVYSMDLAFAFHSDMDHFRQMVLPEQLIVHERVEFVTAKYMIDQSDVAMGMLSEDEYIRLNAMAFQDQFIPTIARMLDRFYPGEYFLGIYTNFQ
jgi:hypothetical protein